MDQLQGQTRLDLGGVLAGPAQEQVPGSQAQVFGDQQPDAEQVAGDLITEQLPNRSLDAGGIGRFDPTGFFRALGVDQRWLWGGKWDVEFFFEGRSR